MRTWREVFDGAPGYVRISHARPLPLLEDGLARLGRVLRNLRAAPVHHAPRDSENR